MVCDNDVMNSDGQGVLDGARAPFFENDGYDGVGIKKELLEGAVLPVRPFAEEEEEYGVKSSRAQDEVSWSLARMSSGTAMR